MNYCQATQSVGNISLYWITHVEGPSAYLVMHLPEYLTQAQTMMTIKMLY